MQQQLMQDEQGNVWDMSSGSPVLVRPAQGPNVVVPAAPNPALSGQLESQGLANAEKGATLPYAAPRARADLRNTETNTARATQGITYDRAAAIDKARDGYRQDKRVLGFEQAAPVAMSALQSPENGAGDATLVNAIAKVTDPTTGVQGRESEGYQNAQPYLDQLKATLLKQFGDDGYGNFTPEGRTKIREAIRVRLKSLAEQYDQARGDHVAYIKSLNLPGINPETIIGPHAYAPFQKVEEQYIREHGGTPKVGGVPVDQVGMASGSTHNEYDPKVSAEMNAAIRAGIPYDRASALAARSGYPAPDRATYDAAVAYAKAHPDYRKSLAEATRTVPTSALQRLAASPLGAAISGASRAGTLGFIDEIAASLSPGDYVANRDAFAGKQDLIAANHPMADLIGQLAGGFAAGAGMAGAMSKVPALQGGMFGSKILPNLLSREGVAGDAAFGAGYGAGSNNEDRLKGGVEGLGLGIGGGIAARGTVNGLASAISPTGGAMRPLYDMGVRPSIGQRIGGVPNTLEEKFQSIPLVGDAIKGTRDRARDQYQIGLFNDSLAHIGERLPEGMRPGHEPHAFAQDAISRAYDGALSNMSAAADQQFSQDLGGLQRQLQTLKPDHRNQFQKIWDDSVARRFQNGQLAGENYKAAESELSARVAKLRKNPADNELADALEQATGALRASALRNSPPEAVQALNSADAAHAKIVRLEEASRKAGEPAEFSPTQYNTAVKTTSGGVRNRNYLRGDALNTEIAALGTRLGDKVSNSGSIDRLAAGMAATGAGYVNPVAATALGGLGVLNAPGIRNIVTELMAPRSNPLFDRAAEQLRQRARLAGMFGAPAAIDYFGGQ